MDSDVFFTNRLSLPPFAYGLLAGLLAVENPYVLTPGSTNQEKITFALLVSVN